MSARQRLGVLAMLALLAPWRASGAQAGLSPFVKDYKVDFAIPDAPAFKLLDVDQSAILRPQTARDLVMAFNGFRGSANSFVVPKQLGVEFSPGLLVGGGQLTISDYDARKYLYSTRFSGATGRDSLNRGRMAAGVRFTFVDEQDIRSKGGGGNDTVVTRLTQRALVAISAARLRAGPPPAPLVLNDTEAALVKAVSDSVREYWAEKYWNANALEVAFGGRARSADSLGHDPKLDEAAFWVTYANGLKGWGQLLLGAKLGSSRDSSGSFHAANAFSARMYVGSNALKAFVEGQQSLSTGTAAQWLANSGVELRLPSVGWVNASAGYASNPDGGRAKLISSFTFKAAVPGM